VSELALLAVFALTGLLERSAQLRLVAVGIATGRRRRVSVAVVVVIGRRRRGSVELSGQFAPRLLLLLQLLLLTLRNLDIVEQRLETPAQTVVAVVVAVGVETVLLLLRVLWRQKMSRGGQRARGPADVQGLRGVGVASESRRCVDRGANWGRRRREERSKASQLGQEQTVAAHAQAAEAEVGPLVLERRALEDVLETVSLHLCGGKMILVHV